MKKQIYLFLTALMVLLCSCDPHEWPKLSTTDLYVDLVFDFSDIPLFKEITISHDSYQSRGSQQRQAIASPQMRYVLRCYALSADSVNYELMPQSQFIFTNDDLQDPNYRCRITLVPGQYKIKVWADYVEHGSKDDMFYNTYNFNDIFLTDNTNDYVGSTELRDAFIGEQEVVVEHSPDMSMPSNVSAHIMMERPFAKFKFITTDIPDFVGKYLGISDPEKIKDVDFSDYRVLFRYTGYLPTHFNMFTDKPFDAGQGYQFFSTISEPTATEATLGFDYVFVNGRESSVSVAVGIYDREGTLLSFSDPVEVPLKRNHVTVVRDKFLSQGGHGNVGINPEYEGSYTIFYYE